jgi:hypothetical protein
VDQAPANDLLHRVQWRQLLDDAAKRRATRSAPAQGSTGDGSPGVLERLNAGEISWSQAAKKLKIGYATLKRLLDSHNQGLQEG